MFIKNEEHDFLVAQVYTDEITFGGSPPILVIGFVEKMKSKFEMSMVGKLTFFLGF